MGRQSSRIIWDKIKMHPDGGDYGPEKVTEWESEIIYVSGNMVISGEKLYKCIATESLNQQPEFTYGDDVWQLLEGVKRLYTVNIPDSEAQKVINSKRLTFSPGARVIAADKKSETGKLVLFECTRRVNVYLHGFNQYSDWMPVYQDMGANYMPRDHKDVYYDDGRNATKWHRAMYYVPDDDYDFDEEVNKFDESISYYEGELAIYSQVMDYGEEAFHKEYKLYRYIHGVPSTPSRFKQIKGTYDQYREYTQPRPTNTQYWEEVEGVGEFDKNKVYHKGDMVIYDRYSDEFDGSPTMSIPVGVFNYDYEYTDHSDCLYPIKPAEDVEVSQKDLEALVANGDYEWVHDEIQPEIVTAKPITVYAENIESNMLIYGWYSRIQDKGPKRSGVAFNNDEWRLQTSARMFDVDFPRRCLEVDWKEMPSNGKTLHLAYTEGSYVIAPIPGQDTYGLYRCKKNIYAYLYERDTTTAPEWNIFHVVNKVTPDTYYADLTPADECYRIWPNDMRMNEYAKDYWQQIMSSIGDKSMGKKLFKTAPSKEVIMPGKFTRQNWIVVSQTKKSNDDLYGWIWKKYGTSKGGTPFTALFPIPGYDGRNLRFDSLTLFRGDNVLELGPIVSWIETGGYTGPDPRIITAGASAYILPLNYNTSRTDIFFVKKYFENNWKTYKFSDAIPDITPRSVYSTGAFRFGFQARNNNSIVAPISYYNIGLRVKNLKLIIADNGTMSSIHVDKLVDNIGDIIAEGPYRFVEDTFSSSCVLIDKLAYVTGTSEEIFRTVIVPNPLGYSDLLEGYRYFKLSAMLSDNLSYVANFIEDIDYYLNYTSTVEGNEILGGDSRGGIIVLPGSTDLHPLLEYISKDLTYETDERIFSVEWFQYEDGWDGYDSEYADAHTMSNTYAALHVTAFRNFILNYCGGTELTFKDSEEIEISTYVHGHHAILLRGDRYTYKTRAPYILLHSNPDKFPKTFDIIHKPVIGDFYLKESTGTINYLISYFYGYVCKNIDSDDESKNGIGFYSLVTLTKIFLSGSGSTITIPVIEFFLPGYPAEGEDQWTNINYILFPGRNSSSVVFYTDRYVFIFNSTHLEIITASTGLWAIDLSTGERSTVLRPFLDNYYRWIFSMCHIEKIPYYGNQTVTLRGGRKIKYITARIANWVVSEYDRNDFYDELQAQYETDLVYEISIVGWLNNNAVPTFSTVGSSPADNGDLIVAGWVYIDDYRYYMTIVLPAFKIIYPNSYRRGAYNPISTGAFFWLTNDNIYTRANPQYGGPEAGASGFSGW